MMSARAEIRERPGVLHAAVGSHFERTDGTFYATVRPGAPASRSLGYPRDRHRAGR